MIDLRHISKSTFISVVILMLLQANASAKCELSHYIFQDQQGNEATVKMIRECFSWFNKDRPSLSGKRNKCYLEGQVNHVIDSHKKQDIRIVGMRLITVLYKSRFVNISEEAVVGSPWLSYEVNPDLRKIDVSAFQESGPIYSLLDGGEVMFDFTKDAPGGFDTPEALYKDFLGKEFIFKRCRE